MSSIKVHTLALRNPSAPPPIERAQFVDYSSWKCNFHESVGRNQSKHTRRNNPTIQLSEQRKPRPKGRMELERVTEQLAKSQADHVASQSQFMSQEQASFQSQAAKIKELKTQVMCITDIVSGLQNINSPNAFEFNSSREDKEQCKVVTLRSGKTLGNSVKSDEVEENKKGETWTQEVNEVE